MLHTEALRNAAQLMRYLITAATLFLAFTAFVASSAPQVHSGGNCDADPSIDRQEEALLDLINGHRRENGLGPLVLSDSLNRAAEWKSAHMANNDYFAHDDLGLNRDFVGRLRDCGYAANTWLAENIAAGNSSAQGTFDQWRNSAGHNSNMLNANMAAIGIARVFDSDSAYGWYWTAEFGGEDDGYSEPEPAPPPASLPEKSGDVNCADGTTSIDAALVLQFSAALVTSLPCEDAADVSGDEEIGARDAVIILQISAGFFS